jgi:hypothetical protein
MPLAGRCDDLVNAQLPWHARVLDKNGKLLAWYKPEQNLGYDRVCHLAWEFIEQKVPEDTRTGTGLKIYLINAVFDGKTLQGTNWQGNPASTFAQFVDSLMAWYPYSGDKQAIEVVRAMLDHQLAHGTTPASWEWASVPFATTCDDDPNYGGCLRGGPKDFRSGIESDKVGELGTGYALFYEMTGDKNISTPPSPAQLPWPHTSAPATPPTRRGPFASTPATATQSTAKNMVA